MNGPTIWLTRMAALLLAGIVPQSAEACAVCFGAPGSPETKALSFAIAALLGVLGVVLACIVTFIVYLARHSGEST